MATPAAFASRLPLGSAATPWRLRGPAPRARARAQRETRRGTPRFERGGGVAVVKVVVMPHHDAAVVWGCKSHGNFAPG